MIGRRPIEIVGCHAEGEVGDVIVGGVDPPPGSTLWEQARWVARDGTLRDFVLNEPRGGVFRHVNLLVPPVDERADAGFIVMEPVHTPPMSGSNAMCVATVLLTTGLVTMREPETVLRLEAPGGVVDVRASCRDGRVDRVTITNVASFVGVLDATIDVAGFGPLRVDTAYGGDTFVMVDAGDVGADLVAGSARSLAELGTRITAAATDQLGFDHPERPDWRHVSFCQFAGPLSIADDGTHEIVNAVAIEPGKVDRSPTGTGVSARLALLHARGRLGVGDRLRARSIIGSVFEGRVERETTVAGRPAVIPSVSGRTWITGRWQLTLDPSDPWPRGYRLSDTWPGAG